MQARADSAPSFEKRTSMIPDEDPPFVESPLSQRLTRNGVSVQVYIYGDGEGKWILEVVDAQQTSHVWDDHFDTDYQALTVAIDALEETPLEFLEFPPERGGLH
jgi:hypothetical protein